MSDATTIAAIVPAAGASRRMGRDKRRLPLAGRTVIEVTVDRLRQAGVSRIVVVVEPHDPLRGLSGLTGVTFVTNPDPARGMLSSIREGLLALPEDVDAVAVLPGDHPFVPAAAIARVVRHVEQHRPRLLVPRFRGRRGHPLVIDRVLFGEAAACDDAVGLRQLLRRRADVLVELDLDVDPAADDDLDRPEDLSRLAPKR